MIALLFFISLSSWGQTTLFSENMGTPSATTSIALNTFQQSGTLTYSNGAQDRAADVRVTNVSSTYTGASGGGNVFFTTANAAYGFSIESINASNYTSLTLQFGYRKDSASLFASFSVDYWNGSAWTTLANTPSDMFNEAVNAASGWYLSKSLALPVGAQIDGLKIRFVKTGTASIRIDDVVVKGIIPTITIGGTVAAVNTTYGTASASPTSFTVAGTNINAGINIAPPVGFEVATSNDFSTTIGTNASPLILGTSGTINATTIYLRLAATAAVSGSPYSGNVVCSSTNAVTKNVITVLSNVSPKTLTISGLSVENKSYDGTNSATYSGSPVLNGVVNSDEISLTGTGVATFDNATAGNGKTVSFSGYGITGANASNYSLTAPTSTANISKIGQSINFSVTSPVLYPTVTSINLGAISTSGLNISYNSSNQAVATVSGNLLTLLGAGFTTITASQSGDSNYDAATPVDVILEVQSAGLPDQTISFGTLLNKTYGDDDYALTATASSGNTVSYESSNPAVATIVSGNIHIVGPGSTTITASQNGIPGFNPAPIATQNLTVVAKELTVSSAVAQSKIYDGNNSAIITGASLVGIVGIDNVIVLGGGTFSDANAGPLKTVIAALTLSGTAANKYTLTQPTGLTASITPADQTITFDPLSNKNITDASFTLTALASSGLTISYVSSNPAVANVTGNTVTLYGAGVTTITASQVGNGNFNAASNVDQTLTVTQTAVPIAGWDFSTQIGGPGNFGTSPLAVSSKDTNITVGSLTRGSGFGTIPNTSSGAGAAWGSTVFTTSGTLAGEIAANKFYTFTIAPNSGYKVSLSGIAAYNVRKSASGPTTGQWQYQIDNGTFSDIGSPITWGSVTSSTGNAQPAIDLSGITELQNVNSTSTITIRLVPYGATATTGSNYLKDLGNSTGNDLIINGIVSALPPPIISSSLAENAIVGTLFNYNIVASNTPASYNATGLPNGLTINTTSGLISGTPSNTGTYNVSISATNSSGTNTKTLVLTITQGNQTIVFGTLATKVYGDVPFILNGTVNSGYLISYQSSDTNVATISGNTVTIVGAGTTTITASQNGDSNYSSATDVLQTLTVNKANQSITFGALPSKLDTDAAFTLGATTSSGLTISYSSSDSSVLAITGNTATINGPGVATITASQGGNNNYNAAISVLRDQAIINTSKTNQTITFGVLSNMIYGDASFDLNASSDSGLTISYLSSDPSVVSVSGNTLTIHKPGTVDITASQAGNVTFNPATNVIQSLLVNKKTLTISNVVVANKTYNGTTSATITSSTLNGVVGLDDVSTTNSPVFVSENVGSGISITPNFALQGSEADRYLLTQPIVMGNILGANQTITFGALASKTFGDVAFTLSATGGASGNAVTFSSSDPSIASVSGNTVTILGAGTITITASQAAGGNYAAAIDVPQSLVIAKKVNTITFATISTRYTTDVPFALTASASSTLAVTYSSSNPAVATVTTGGSVTIVGVGTTNIIASQVGNSNYLAATDVIKSLKVTLPPIAAWNVFGLNQTATATATTFNNLVSSGNNANITRGAGATASTGANSFRSTGFSNNGINTSNTDYFQVVLQPTAGHVMSLSTIDAVFNGTASYYAGLGVTSQFAYSLNGSSFTLIGSPVQSTSLTMGTIDVSGISELQNIPNGTTVTLRYFASGQTTTGGWGFFSAAATSAYALAIGGSIITASPNVSDQVFCNSALVSNLTATGTAIKWYDVITGGAALAPTTALTSGTYYVTQTVDGIESARTAVLVTINNSNAGTITPNQTITWNAQPADISLTNSSGDVQWQSSTNGVSFSNINGATGTTLLGTTIGALTNSTYYRAIVTSGNCTSATSAVHLVTIITTTNIRPSQCGSMLSTMNTQILAVIYPSAQMYRFEVSNGAEVRIYDTTKYNFDLNKLPGTTYATTYSIRVAVKINGVWGNFGNSCNITTPSLSSNVILTTKVNPAFCGTTLAALDTKIPATIVQNATGYRFEIITGGVTTVYDSATYNFKLSQAGVAAYGTTYAIRVAALVSGTYGNYGASCNVSTPVLAVNSVPTTTIHPSFCGATLAALDTKIGAVIVAGATKGRFEVTIEGGSPIVYEVAAYNFKLSETGVAVLYNTNYAIRVAALVNDVWGNYGTSCTVTTPSAPITRMKTKTFEVAAYPNPFETAFNLNLETPCKEVVTIAVYDMMGKLVENHQVNPLEVANLQIGNNFAAGIYNVIVSQANEMEAIRLIRK